MSLSLEGRRVWVAGHRGMAGSAIVRRLEREPCEVLTADRAELDLRDQRATIDWLAATRPDAVFLAAAKVGGIVANRDAPAEFLYDNLTIQANVVHGAWRAGVAKLLFLGSSCIYPKHAPQPMAEEALLTGPLEPTNEWYAIAKIAGVKLCQAYRRQYGADFISVMPTNLYGQGDNFSLTSSHVLPALLRKVHTAKAEGRAEVEIWGTGAPRREFMHVDDLADACVFLMQSYSDESPLNIGTGEEVSIADLAALIAEVVGYEGAFVFDTSKPDGTPRKLLDLTRLHAAGWRSKVGLRDGVRRLYEWYRQQGAPGGLRL